MYPPKSYPLVAIKFFVGGLVALMAGTGCNTPLPPPDLGELYTRAAQYHGVERRPVIVIPGILGSRLVDPETDTVVWGAFGRRFIDPNQAEGAQLTALPMKKGVSLSDLTDGVIADGALDRFTINLLYIPLELKAYAQILYALGAGGYRDADLSEIGGVDYGDDHFTCFQFPYDWRRSVADNAQRLHAFILDKRSYVQAEYEKRYGVKKYDVKFDIVAHSMGGLLTRYYLRYGASDLKAKGPLPDLTWAGANYVRRAVLVAPPNAGSVTALERLVKGLDASPVVVYPPAIGGTMPSVYELMPRVRHQAVVNAEDGSPIDIYDLDVWKKNQWGLADPDADRILQYLLPDEEDPAVRRRIALDHVRKCLNHAKRLHEALDKPAAPPPGIDIELVAGDATDTSAVISVWPETGDLEVIQDAPGDGTVLRSSALMDERVGGEWAPMLISPIHWSQVLFLFKGHLGLTRDAVFVDNVLYRLLEEP